MTEYMIYLENIPRLGDIYSMYPKKTPCYPLLPQVST